MELCKVEKSVLQLLVANKFIEDSDLQSMCEKLREEFGESEAPAAHIFKRINEKVRDFGLEVRTVIVNRGDRTRTYFHGLVNTELDDISKELGSQLDAEEMKFFSILATKFIELKKMNTEEAAHMRIDGWARSKAEDTLIKLRNEGWLGRDERSNWILGTRTYLELTPMLQELIREDQVDGYAEEEDHMQLSDLPQTIFY